MENESLLAIIKKILLETSLLRLYSLFVFATVFYVLYKYIEEGIIISAESLGFVFIILLSLLFLGILAEILTYAIRNKKEEIMNRYSTFFMDMVKLVIGALIGFSIGKAI